MKRYPSPTLFFVFLYMLASSSWLFAQDTLDCTPGNQINLPPLEGEALYGSRMQRTMTLLATSSPQRHYPVTILVYGQSISGGLKNSCLEEAIRQRFPHANITFINRAIGGFSANQLVRSADADIYPLYPDLVILHDYGVGLPEYERIIRNIRQKTTADILLWTHHRGASGEKGSEEYEARIARERDMSLVICYLAQKYNCELVDVWSAWNQYLEANALDPRALLKDNVHVNEWGNKLLVAILMKHFRLNALAHNNWMETVKSYEVKRLADEGDDAHIKFPKGVWQFEWNAALGVSPKKPLKLEFEGNRVDVVAGLLEGMDLGSATILIDGKKPSEIPELYAFTRATPAFGADYQPGIRRIRSQAPLLVEDWKLRVTKLYDDGRYDFELIGSETGFDGKGQFDPSKFILERFGNVRAKGIADTQDMQFVSNSGRIVIDYRDLKNSWALERTDEPLPPNFEISWKVIPLFVDVYQAPGRGDQADIQQITLVKCLPNGRHVLEIIPNGDGVVPLEEIIVYEPPLK